ncbi:MFS transporter [Janibacter sp. G56]|uniref:MFS transporter n=1 Tax=Janibacter sp. G56 TaxID=3418717 RepID=UPI003D02485A
MRARLLILASSVAMIGWGTVLPYQYAYASEGRNWGTLVAVGAASLFSLGALLAAPVGGRLADRHNPVAIAAWARAAAAVALVGLAFADSATAFLLGMAAFGVGVTAAGPAQSVLVLLWVPSAGRRKIFAWQFTGQALGMAVGAFAAGYLVDLSRPDGMDTAFLLAGLGFLASAVTIVAAGWGAPRAEATTVPAPADAERSGAPGAGAAATVRALWAVPALRWTALVTVTLALGFYAQFEAGLPAYALTVLDLDERSIGHAAAINCVVILALQMVVVRFTAHRSSASLLMVVATVWIASWLLLSLAQLSPQHAATIFITTFGVFAVGETMYAPVLNPLTASLAPEGMVGTTLGVFAALQTGISAAGPLVAGVLLGAGLGQAFLGIHLGISAVALFAAWRLRACLRAEVPTDLNVRTREDAALAA